MILTLDDDDEDEDDGDLRHHSQHLPGEALFRDRNDVADLPGLILGHRSVRSVPLSSMQLDHTPSTRVHHVSNNLPRRRLWERRGPGAALQARPQRRRRTFRCASTDSGLSMRTTNPRASHPGPGRSVCYVNLGARARVWKH
eukprot:3493702-Rhodomonas_salina.3